VYSGKKYSAFGDACILMMSFCSMAMGLLFKFLVTVCPSTKKNLSFAWLGLQV
jgi:hypothetical protein